MVRANKEICFLGYAGAFGCYKILEQRMEELRPRYSSRYLKEARDKHIKAVAEHARALDILKKTDFLEDETWINVTTSGVLASLYTWCKDRDIGCRIALKNIPLLQSSVEICEFYGINIYRLRSDCSLIFTDRGYALVQFMQGLGFPCEIIGHLQDGLDKVIVDKEDLEYINRPTKDEIRKVMDLS